MVILNPPGERGITLPSSGISSFFLVFLALLLAILSTYITTNRVLSSYNKKVKNKLNDMTNIPEIYSLGNDCYVQVGESNDIITTCFKTYKVVSNPIINDDYICVYADNPALTIYNTSSLNVSVSPYVITCKVRNKLLDERYLSSATTNIYVVDQLNP